MESLRSALILLAPTLRLVFSSIMTDDDNTRAEIDALRADIEALRTERLRQTGKALPEPAEPVDRTDDASPQESVSSVVSEQLRELEQAILELAETIEADIAERPVVSVGAAFLLGILVGRSMAR